MTAPLATTEDYELLTTREATAQVGALLEVASATVRRFAGQMISYVEDDEAVVRPKNGVFRLPQRPVIEVTEVVRNGTTLDADTYDWTRQGILQGPDNLNRFDLDLVWGCVPLTVTYSHGYEEIPWDVIAVVVGLADRGLAVEPNAVRQESETIGGYSKSVTYASDSRNLTESDILTLSGLRMPVGSIDTYPSWA